MCVVLLRLMKTKISTCCFPFVNIGTSPDRTEQSFAGRIFNFAQMKASVELCSNKLSDAAAKSKLKANFEKFDSEFGELRTSGGCVASGMAFWKGTERLGNWSSPYTKRKTGVNEPTTAASLFLVSQEECMPWRHENNWTKAGWYPFISVASGGGKGLCLPPKFLENIVILCFERRFSKQNSVIHLKSNILTPSQFLGWLRHCTHCGFRCRRSTTEQIVTPVNFREILGACQRSIDMFCPRESMESILPGSSWKVLGVLWEYGVDWCLLLAVK